MHNSKPNLKGLPDWGARFFTLKTTFGKLDSKANEGCWLIYSGVSKGHRIYGLNHQITVERNITFENNILEVPSPIQIAGEDDKNSTVKYSNQNTTVQNVSNKPNQQQLHNPLADAIPCNPSDKQSRDAGKNLINNIIGDLKK